MTLTKGYPDNLTSNCERVGGGQRVAVVSQILSSQWEWEDQGNWVVLHDQGEGYQQPITHATHLSLSVTFWIE